MGLLQYGLKPEASAKGLTYTAAQGAFFPAAAQNDKGTG